MKKENLLKTSHPTQQYLKNGDPKVAKILKGGSFSKKSGWAKTLKGKEGKLRVWWIPQIGMKNSFYVKVATPREAKKVLDVLAEYDLFQFDNHIKPDFSNAGGLEVFENGEWSEWSSKEGEDIRDINH